MKITVFIIIFLSAIQIAKSDNYIRTIYIDNGNVFPDSTSNFMSRIINSLHFPTRPYIIEQELLFGVNDIVDEDLLLESERNLRRMNIFTDVDIRLDTVGYDLVDVYVNTTDKWSTTPALLIGSGGGQTESGFKLEDDNLAGRAYFLSLQALKRTENDIGWQGSVFLNKTRFFRQNFDINLSLISHKYKTTQIFGLSKPFRNLLDAYSWQFKTKNIFGNDFLYNEQLNGQNQAQQLLGIHEQKISAYYSKAFISDLRSFATVYIDINSTDRGLPQFRRAFDNTGKFLIEFSSVSEDYFKTNRLNTYQDEDIMVGGYGSVILGRTFPIDSTGDKVWYAGARGERSWVGSNWYIYTQVGGGSGFDDGFAKYTFQDSKILGFLTLGPKQVIATRFRQQTAWNWPADRQLVLDNDYGLRGFELNRLAGDSRIQSNLEYRFFPGWKAWVFKVSWAAFYDMGTTWDQDFGFENARWYKSAGLGIRFHNEMASGKTNVYRIDFAYNFDDMKFGGIVFTTGQQFSLFDIHNFRIPDIFGLDFDGE
ncbi:hypothetical protein OAQ99_00845 [Candidatus Kapabacteria bacterium]|nr:hypothetical protein [Candidatus Kapabacteria bacterium]